MWIFAVCFIWAEIGCCKVTWTYCDLWIIYNICNFFPTDKYFGGRGEIECFQEIWSFVIFVISKNIRNSCHVDFGRLLGFKLSVVR